MNKFKERAYIPPVEKYKKTIGKYQEKIDKHFAIRKQTQATWNKNTQTVFTQTVTKTKTGYVTYFILFLLSFIFILFALFIILVAMNSKETQIEL